MSTLCLWCQLHASWFQSWLPTIPGSPLCQAHLSHNTCIKGRNLMHMLWESLPFSCPIMVLHILSKIGKVEDHMKPYQGLLQNPNYTSFETLISLSTTYLWTGENISWFTKYTNVFFADIVWFLLISSCWMLTMYKLFLWNYFYLAYLCFNYEILELRLVK